MAAGEGHAPDWRDAAAYEPLLEADRSICAWEWLRRQPAYRAAALECLEARPQLPFKVLAEQPRALPWGLHVFEDPDLAVPAARPIWSSSRLRFVLKATAEPWSDDGDALMLNRFSNLATMVAAPDSERLLLSDGFRSIRLDVHGASFLRGPVILRYDLHGFAALNAPLLVLGGLRALVATGNLCGLMHQSDRRARRHILLLRTHDALAAGANQRAIAAELLGTAAAQRRWRVQAPSLRSQVQRLVRGARHMANGGFWGLLR